MQRREHGFTLIEMLLSVGIIALLAGMSLPLYQSFDTRNELDISTQSLASALRRAQVYARGANDDSQWGVHIQSGTITLFKGAVWASRDVAYDEVTSVSPSTAVSGLGEVLFAKLSGAPNTTGSVTLTNVNDEIRTVTINAKGMVAY
jgi:prepilin-type N-terminal cleavage/methylation domain-containing protein